MIKKIMLQRKGKKGVLFTIGLMLLTLVILALAVLIFRNSQEYESIINKLVVLDRVYDLDTSIQGSIGQIFELNSGISINVTNKSVSFEETLPNNGMEAFNDSIHSFKHFVESSLSNINISIGDMGSMPLRIMPENAAYKHRDNWSNIEVVPGASPNFDGYSIFIDVGKGFNVSCDWSGVDEDPDVFNLSLEVKADKEDCTFQTKKIDPSADNKIIINRVEDGSELILIEVKGGGRLLINRTSDIEVTARTSILTETVQRVMADDLGLDFDFGDFGVTKQSDVRII